MSQRKLKWLDLDSFDPTASVIGVDAPRNNIKNGITRAFVANKFNPNYTLAEMPIEQFNWLYLEGELRQLDYWRFSLQNWDSQVHNFQEDHT